MIVDDQARGNPPRTQVGGRSHCPWVTVGDRSFRQGRGRFAVGAGACGVP
jgi:hypothetical protein